MMEIILSMVLALSSITSGFSAETNLSELEEIKSKANGSYCGLYCVYSYMKLNGKEISFNDLLNRKYINKSNGSSLEELKNAFIDFGMNAVPVSGLTVKDISNMNEHMILHVKLDASKSRLCDHYVLYLGTKSKKALILDPPKRIELVDYSDLSRLWDGKGLIVSKEAISTDKILFSAKTRRLKIYLSCLLLVIAIKVLYNNAAVFKKIPLPMLTGAIQSIIITCIVLLIAFLYNILVPTAFLFSLPTTAPVVTAYRSTFIDNVSVSQAKKKLSKGVLFVDARYERDYKAGHIDGALNIPVDSSAAAINALIKNIDKEKDIVIYCQSKKCPFAKHIAVKLLDLGCLNLSVLEGGWNEWINFK